MLGGQRVPSAAFSTVDAATWWPWVHGARLADLGQVGHGAPAKLDLST